MDSRTRELVYKKFDGRCAYCGERLNKGWHVDHLLPIRRITEYDHVLRVTRVVGLMHPEREAFDNLMPSCPSCNINKHSEDIETFRNSIKHYMVHLNQHSTQYKIAKRYGLVEEKDIKVEFFYEKYITNGE